MERPERDDLIAELRALADEARGLAHRLTGSWGDWLALIAFDVFGDDSTDAGDEVVIWEIKVRNALAGERAALAAFDADPPRGFGRNAARRLKFRRRSLDAILKAYGPPGPMP